MNNRLFFIFISLMISQSNGLCVIPKDNRDIERNNFTYPETIQSDNFVVQYS